MTSATQRIALQNAMWKIANDVEARIVSILDKFDTLVNSLSEGLPREIALRHKQYEYYRDQLLTFPEGCINCDNSLHINYSH